MNFPKILSCFLLLCFSLGCASNLPSSTKLRQVSLGMTKDDVLANLGEPRSARGSIKNKFNQVIEVWEYKFEMPSKDSSADVTSKTVLTVFTGGLGAFTFSPEKKDYWLYFLDNKLVQWGEAGDWKKEPDRIYEFNFDPAPSLIK